MIILDHVKEIFSWLVKRGKLFLSGVQVIKEYSGCKSTKFIRKWQWRGLKNDLSQAEADGKFNSGKVPEVQILRSGPTIHPSFWWFS